eukprot:3171687-Ditylum_brightwellii.AAC.1
MLEFKFIRTTAKDNILMSSYIVDIHEMTYTETKGIWTIESTVEDLNKVLADIESSLEVLPEVLSKEYFNIYNAFPSPQVIPTYGTTYRYIEQITSNVFTVINENKKKLTRDRSERQQTNKTKQDNNSNKIYKQLKDNIKKSQ